MHVKKIFDAALQAAMPQHVLPKHVFVKQHALHVNGTCYPLPTAGKLFLFGSGKAARSMGEALVECLGEHLHGGLLVTPHPKGTLGPLALLHGAHPVPTQESLDAGQALLEQMGGLSEEDFYIYVLSGGSSAMIEALHPSLSLSILQETTQILLSHALPIQTINGVRKSLSRIKNGGLARSCKAKGVVLVVSDVIGDDLGTIGSAPLMPTAFTPPSLPKEAFEALHPLVKAALQNPPLGLFEAPPHHFVATNRLALDAAKTAAQALGYETHVLSDTLEGEVLEVAQYLHAQSQTPVSKPTCWLYGGETTVTLTGSGKGGRNQHLALAFLRLLQDPAVSFLSAGTDGIDGNSGAAGAWATMALKTNAKALGLELETSLQACDSASFFKALGAQIHTGPTGTNVMDVMVITKTPTTSPKGFCVES